MFRNQLLDCHKRIKPYIHRTPVLTSRLLNDISGAKVFFKCENFQRMGAYKMRGATNAILLLSEEERAKGVVTHSSGNFAQALSLAAQSLEVQAHTVRQYGGNIVECDQTIESRKATADKIARETGATFIHPSNDMNVIIGQGTAAMELLEDYPKLDFIFTPIGGGGLIAGTALSANYFGDNCKVVGGEPFEADDAYRSFHSGKIESNYTTNTIADGLKTVLGDNTFPIIQKYVHDIIRVTEDEIVSAMRLIWERLKIIAEPSSAVAFAALIREKENYKGKSIGVIISGGNVDLNQLPF